MKVVDLEQGCPKWLHWRNCGVGGSDISALTNHSPYILGPQELYKLKKGIVKKKPIAKAAIEHGSFAEKVGLEAAGLELDMRFRPICVMADSDDFLRVSLDGWDEKTRTILECKAVTQKVFNDIFWNGQVAIPIHIMEQIQYQMAICETSNAYLYYQNNTSGERELLKITPCEQTQIQLITLALNFKKSLDTSTMPEIGPNEYMDLSNTALEGDMSLCLTIKNKIAESEQTTKRLKDRLHDIVDRLTDGTKRDRLAYKNVRISKVIKQGAVDHKSLLKAQGIGPSSINDFRKPSTSYYKVSIVKEEI